MEGRREQEKTEAVAFLPWKTKARPVGGLERRKCSGSSTGILWMEFIY